MSRPLMSERRIAEIRQAIHLARQSTPHTLPVDVAAELLDDLVRTRGFMNDGLDEVESCLGREAAKDAEIARLRAELDQARAAGTP